VVDGWLVLILDSSAVLLIINITKYPYLLSMAFRLLANQTVTKLSLIIED